MTGIVLQQQRRCCCSSSAAVRRSGSGSVRRAAAAPSPPSPLTQRQRRLGGAAAFSSSSSSSSSRAPAPRLPQQQQRQQLLHSRPPPTACRSSAADNAAAVGSSPPPPPPQALTQQPPPLVVVEGDVVTFHMACRAPDGALLESSREAGEPLSFEIGAGEVTGNPLFQAFDGALRGRGVGEAIELEISGGEWRRELLFTVPRDHPEVERLEGRYKNLGGLHKDLAVELANGSMAVVVEATPEAVTLDANSMLSGKTLTFELEVLGIERPES